MATYRNPHNFKVIFPFQGELLTLLPKAIIVLAGYCPFLVDFMVPDPEPIVEPKKPRKRNPSEDN